MKYLNKILPLILLLLLSNCGIKDLEFDKQKWSKQVDGFYEYRENMVNDLLKNQLRKGMSYDQMIDLIGEPENYGHLESNTVNYLVVEKYGWGIDPVETKTLKIELSEDSLVINYNVKHWKE